MIGMKQVYHFHLFLWLQLYYYLRVHWQLNSLLDLNQIDLQKHQQVGHIF